MRPLRVDAAPTGRQTRNPTDKLETRYRYVGMVRSIFSALVLVVMTASAVPAFAQVVRVPGTNVSLVPPAGFSPARQYPGFEQESGQASIMVTELPGAAADMLRARTGEALATRGWILVTARDPDVSGHPARRL